MDNHRVRVWWFRVWSLMGGGRLGGYGDGEGLVLTVLRLNVLMA
jgi:hypothetical protein